MIARKCDRCGAYYEPYNVGDNDKEPNGIMFLKVNGIGTYVKPTIIDLCPSCMEDVKKFVLQAEKNKIGDVEE